MIKDSINNAHIYYDVSSGIKKGLEFLKNSDLENFKPDKYILDGDNMYVNIETYQTKTTNNIEAHKKYIDIQYIIDGEENIGVTSLDKLMPLQDYNEEKDIAFYKGDVSFIKMQKGDFLILYPQDAHLPCQTVNEVKHVKKAVVKVKVNQSGNL